MIKVKLLESQTWSYAPPIMKEQISRCCSHTVKKKLHLPHTADLMERRLTCNMTGGLSWLHTALMVANRLNKDKAWYTHNGMTG